MSKQAFTLTEWFYWLVRTIFGSLSTPFTAIANWATDRLNKSYYRGLSNDCDQQAKAKEALNV